METFQQLINSGTPVLVDFFAEWCGPCKAMTPVIREVAEETRATARVLKVDIDKMADASGAFNIQAVPTFIIFKDGKAVWRHSGMIDKASLINQLKSFTENKQ